MHPRINVARFLIKTGRVIQSLAVIVMRPDDLVEFSRQNYKKSENIHSWCNERRINSGLSQLEQSLLKKIGMKKGRLLLLGVGGGREAIPLSKMGFDVTGVDFIPQMVEQAKENARKNSVEISGLVQEISKLDLPENSFSVIWLSAAMYSCVPTRKRRGEMLAKIRKALERGGYFIFVFFWRPKIDASPKSVFVKKILAWLSLGNLHYEKGDMLLFNSEFLHAFSTVEELHAEMAGAGLDLIDTQINDENEFAGAIAKKPS